MRSEWDVYLPVPYAERQAFQMAELSRWHLWRNAQPEIVPVMPWNDAPVSEQEADKMVIADPQKIQLGT